MIQKDQPESFLRYLGLKENHLFLDIGYYKNGLFTLAASQIIGMYSRLYVLDFKDQALKIRSKDYHLNMIGIFLTKEQKKSGIPFKNYFFDFLMIDFEWIYKKGFNVDFFLKEISRVVGYKKKILIFINQDNNVDMSKQRTFILENFSNLSIKVLESGIFNNSESYYLFLERTL